ncbi:MAG: methyltransferase domain-containing protein [Oscillospiraceae bacterium]|nr:methyltransferase domain-containing protein [Oscillospiraceae bacterium]
MGGYASFARYYDRLTENVEYRSRAEYFARLFQRYCPQPGLVLDLACGTGSLTVELADMGYEMIGVDGSAEMLSAAMAKTGARGLSVLYLCQDMTELDLYGTVGAALCTLDSVNHITSLEELREVFRRVSLFTEPGGVFFFDANTPYKHREILADNAYIYDFDGLYCGWQNAYDPADGSVNIRLDFFSKGKNGWLREQEEFSERAYSARELEELLAETGFELLAVYGDDTMEPPVETTQRWVYAARKR